jgi:glyceraldehyde-3-phosphate dehydrogenase (NADP+)
MAELCCQAGVPAGVLNVVTGRGRDLGDNLVADRRIGMISFTGGTSTGHHLAHVAGPTPLQLELGGKDAALVLDDADIDLAVSHLVKGAFSYSGQRCTAAKVILLAPAVADEFLAKFVKKAENLPIGDPRETDTVVGPMIGDKAADYVWSLIQDAKAKGAKVLTGDKRQGRTLYPTVLDHVDGAMEVRWEEPFGPVVPVVRVQDLRDAIAQANASRYGLQSCVFTRDIDKAMYVGRQLEVGTVNINAGDSRGPDHFPFVGVKDSGMGTQGVHYSISAMTRTRSITLNMREPDNK